MCQEASVRLLSDIFSISAVLFVCVGAILISLDVSHFTFLSAVSISQNHLTILVVT